MFKLQTICASLFLLLISVTTALAQNETAKPDQPNAATITGSASGERVRFTAASSVVQIRLEVYDSSGRKLFDNEVRGGNVLDWHLQDGQAGPLADDAYLCVVTVKSLSGKLTQRIGSVRIEQNSANLQPVDPTQLNAQQTQAVGPVEENAGLLILKDDQQPTTTVIAHDGQDGQITRGKGALSFRIGDFYSGKETEQMRLTPEGNLGIGITHPLVRLDVDGLIRTSKGILFPDGTIQTTAANGTSGVQSSDPHLGGGKLLGGAVGLNSSSARNGKGNAKNNVSPEFMVNEDLTINGNIIFTPSLSRDITAQNNNGGIRIFGAPNLTGSPAAAAIQFFGNGHPGFPGQAYIDAGANDNAAVIFRTAVTGGTITERMRITSAGNVGIGTNAPGRALDVKAPFGDGIRISNSANLYFRNGNNTADVRAVGMDGADNIYFGGNATTGSLIFSNGSNPGTERMRVDRASGNIGIGSTSPLAKFELQYGADQDGGNDPKAMAFAYRSGGFRHWIRTRHNSAAGTGNAFDFYVNSSTTSGGSAAPGTGNVLTMSLAGGNVGISTTSPGAPLEVRRDGDIGGNWQNAQLRISGATDPNMQLNLGYDTTNNHGVIQPGQANTAFTDLLLNPFGGNVGVGALSPYGKLNVEDSSANDALRVVELGNGTGVDGQTVGNGFGVRGYSALGSGTAVAGECNQCTGYAGYFEGNVRVTGNLTVLGTKNFKIDHPLDPANKYLVHASIESSDVKNLYDGVAILDKNGTAVVNLPDWFEALNRDFRYQLTCIGRYAPVYVARGIANHRFKIAGGRPGMRVSWQVTGIRQDLEIKAHPMQVEEAKPEDQRGFYLHPELYGQPEEKGIEWARRPEVMRRLKEQREKAQSARAQ